MANLTQWRKEGRHLPSFMRDFHDQKALFKSIHEQHSIENVQGTELSWVTAHVYTIDSFLWFMAQHGYTLQQCRAHQKFADIDHTLRYWEDKRQAQFASLLTPLPTEQPTPGESCE